MKQNTTTTKHAELLDTQLSAGNNRKETSSERSNEENQLVEYKPIENTPFTIVRQNEDYFLVMGNHRLTEPTKTEEETREKLKTEMWKIIFTVVAIVNEKMSAKTIAELGQKAMDRIGELSEVKLEGLTDQHPMSYGAKGEKISGPAEETQEKIRESLNKDDRYETEAL